MVSGGWQSWVMEAIGEQLEKADDAGSWLPRPAHLHAVPQAVACAVRLGEPSPAGPAGQELLERLAAGLAGAALAAPGVLATATYAGAADYADHIEGLSRTIEYLQLLAAGAVDRTRNQAIQAAATATT